MQVSRNIHLQFYVFILHIHIMLRRNHGQMTHSEFVGNTHENQLLLAQHISGTTMPIIRSSRILYSGAACGISCCGFQIAGLVWS